MGRKKETQTTQPTPDRTTPPSQVTERPQTADPPTPMTGNQSDMLVQLIRDINQGATRFPGNKFETKNFFDFLKLTYV